MRLTASQLRQIIREELSKNAEGQSLDEGMGIESAKNMLFNAIKSTGIDDQRARSIVNNLGNATSKMSQMSLNQAAVNRAIQGVDLSGTSGFSMPSQKIINNLG